MVELAPQLNRDQPLQELDPQRAEQVSPKDEIVDRLYRETLQSLTAIMRTQPERTGECRLWKFLAKHLERIGDPATNIAEIVIYMARGQLGSQEVLAGW